MAIRLSLAKCDDINILKLAKLYKEGMIKSGEGITLPNGKTYFMSYNTVRTKVKNELGEVSKSYLKRDGEWFLQNRKVRNERGSYRRGVNSVFGADIDEVSLGGQQAFQRLEDGRYIQGGFANYPAKIVSSEEIEAAIDYIKGKGSAENYTRLLRDYKN